MYQKNKTKWHILFCDRNQRGCPVAKFLERTQPKHQVKILRFLNLLSQEGPTLPRPYADILADGIHELRVKLSGKHFRLLYFFCYQKFIILYYGFIKTSDRVPEKIVRKVIHYRENFLEQNSKNNLEKIINENF